MKAARHSRQRSGRLAERLAGLWLLCKGYRILARNWKSPAGEIDLIARRGRLVIFVEVKYRPLLDDGLHAIRQTQQERIIRAAEVWLGHNNRNNNGNGFDVRFDAIAIAPFRPLRHIEDAWRSMRDR